MEFVKEDGKMKFVCNEHEIPQTAEMVFRKQKRYVQRTGKRPAAQEYVLLMICCPVCKKYDQGEVEGIVYGSGTVQ